MTVDGRPAMERVDYQCLLGLGSSITATWSGSHEPVETVAGWYRRSLDGYTERESNDWVRERANGKDLVVVAPAGQWPERTPAPPAGWTHGFATFVMEASILTRDAPQPIPEPARGEPGRRRKWFTRPGFLARRRG